MQETDVVYFKVTFHHLAGGTEINQFPERYVSNVPVDCETREYSDTAMWDRR